MYTVKVKPAGILPWAVAAALFLLAATGAQAQLILEEVVVTAQKRAESLSDVPISVNAVAGEKIAESGITNLNDLSDFVPNLSMNQTGIGTNITIRGISSGINPAFEQSVGLYVDDISYGRAQLARIPYLDTDRVEVLRGPQPILFGKNAIAGAISTITKTASVDELEGFINAEYNFDQQGYDVSAAINVPLSDRFAARLAVLKRDQDGYYENTTLDRDEAELDQEVVRLSLHFDPTDNLALDLKVERSTFDTDGRFLEIVNPVTLADAPAGTPSYADVIFAESGIVLDTTQDFRRQANGDIEETEVDNITFKIDYALGEHTLTAITGYLEYDYYQQCDCDFVSAVLIDTTGNETYEQFSQEIRLTSPGGETVDYIVGAFYQDYDVTLDDITIIPSDSILTAASPLVSNILGTGARRAYESDSELWSVFAQFTWNINDYWRLTVGGRYSDEEKTGSRSIEVVTVDAPSPVRDILGQEVLDSGLAATVYAAGFGIETEQGTGHNLAGERSESAFTPSVNVQWDATDNAMLYASITEGFKAGGFDARANNVGSFEFGDEEALSFELGAKMTLAGGAADLNIAIYRTEYDDLQTSQFDGTVGFNVTNAGAATAQGIEIDGRWQASENLLLNYSLGWLDFEFDSFPNSQCYFGEDTPFTTSTGGPSDYPIGDPLNGLCIRDGATREFTPEITANIGAEYFVAVSDGLELTLGLDLAYSDNYFVAPTLDPNLVQDSFIKLNGRIALTSIDAVWHVAVVLENITDEEILTFGSQAPVSTAVTNGLSTAYYGFYEAPFNVALQARYNF